MITPLFVIPFTTLTFIIWNFIIIKFKDKSDVLIKITFISTIKLLTLISLNGSLIYLIYLWKTFPHYLGIGEFGEILRIYPGYALFSLQHNLNLPFLILSTFILIIALLTAWHSAVNFILLSTMLLILEMCLVGAFSCSNLFLFLLFFEISAVPIFILIVYCGSSRRERLKAAYFFMFFTLYGSISLLLLLINFYVVNQLDLTINSISHDYLSNSYIIWILLFIAFAVKIPLFPFHIWLPYAHVEASTASSIILAALMLKLGGYGVLKFMLPMFSMDTHLFFRPFILFICVIGIIYSSIAALRQIDLKRQVAFSSISHMSFATAGIFTFTEVGIKGSMYLMLSHGLTSAILFYLIGVLSDRYHTRIITAYSGLLGIMPLFSGFFIFASLANVGFPGTSGFLPELFVLISVVSIIPTILPFVLLGMFLTTASSLILLLRLLFGHVKTTYSKSVWKDLTKLEYFVLSSLSFWMLVLGLYDILNLA